MIEQPWFDWQWVQWAILIACVWQNITNAGRTKALERRLALLVIRMRKRERSTNRRP